MKFKLGSVLLILLPLAFCFGIVGAYATSSKNQHPEAGGHAAAVAAGPALIAESCQKAAHRQLCRRVLNADPKSETADLKGLSFIALQTASKHATAVASLIKKSVGNDLLDADEQDAIQDCTQNYLSAVEEIDDSIDALAKGDHPNVANHLLTSISDIDSCDDNIQDPDGGILLQVSRGNNVLRQLCENAISLSQLVPGSDHH